MSPLANRRPSRTGQKSWYAERARAHAVLDRLSAKEWYITQISDCASAFHHLFELSALEQLPPHVRERTQAREVSQLLIA